MQRVTTAEKGHHELAYSFLPSLVFEGSGVLLGKGVEAIKNENLLSLP